MNRAAVVVGWMVTTWLFLHPLRVEAQAPAADARLGSARTEVEALMSEATAAGLPAAWLGDKVTEGLAKHAPPPRIVAATRLLLARMQAADAIEARLRLAGPDPARDVLRALVDALEAGAPEAALGEVVARAVRAEGRSRAMVRRVASAVAELGERGLDGPFAVDVVGRAVDAGGADAVGRVLSEARRSEGASPDGLRRALERAAVTPRGPHRGARPPGPPRDDAYGQGRGRGRGR